MRFSGVTSVTTELSPMVMIGCGVVPEGPSETVTFTDWLRPLATRYRSGVRGSAPAAMR